MGRQRVIVGFSSRVKLHLSMAIELVNWFGLPNPPLADGGDGNVFVYMGGEQRRVRGDIRYAFRIHKSVKFIHERAFIHCSNLVSVEMHDDVEIIEGWAFSHCTSLRRIKLLGVRVIESGAFYHCPALEDVEFGDKLESIGGSAFEYAALRNIKMPKGTIGDCAF
jgi:hypothetical protein